MRDEFIRNARVVLRTILEKMDIIIITDIDTYAWSYRNNIGAYIVSRSFYFGMDAFSSILAKPMLENIHDERLNHWYPTGIFHAAIARN